MIVRYSCIASNSVLMDTNSMQQISLFLLLLLFSFGCSYSLDNDPRNDWKLCPDGKQLILIGNLKEEHCMDPTGVDMLRSLNKRFHSSSSSVNIFRGNGNSSTDLWTIHLSCYNTFRSPCTTEPQTLGGLEVRPGTAMFFHIYNTHGYGNDRYPENCSCDISLRCPNVDGFLGPLTMTPITHCRKWAHQACQNWFPDLAESTSAQFPKWVAAYLIVSVGMAFCMGVILLIFFLVLPPKLR